MGKMSLKKKTLIAVMGGAVTGFLNGLLGAGGGIVAVPTLKAAGLKENKAHSNSVGVIVPWSAFSAALYMLNGSVKVSEAVDRSTLCVFDWHARV